jgi:hypothetical protein
MVSCKLGCCFYVAPAKAGVQGIRPTLCIRCPWLSFDLSIGKTKIRFQNAETWGLGFSNEEICSLRSKVDQSRFNGVEWREKA